MASRRRGKRSAHDILNRAFEALPVDPNPPAVKEECPPEVSFLKVKKKGIVGCGRGRGRPKKSSKPDLIDTSKLLTK